MAFGIEKRIAKLGDRLATAFYQRSLHYFQKASPVTDESSKRNFQLVGAMLAEVSQVIRDVTSQPGEESSDDSQDHP